LPFLKADRAISLNAPIHGREGFNMADSADIHYQTVSQRVPPWLLQADAGQRQALRASVPPALPWLDAATRQLPEVVQAWREEAQRHEQCRQTLERILAGLPSVEDYAAPLLHEALKSRFGLELDVRRTFLFNAVRARVAETRLHQDDPAVRAFQAVKAATSPLLQAALQNFEAFEAQPDGLRDGRRTSSLFVSASGQPLDPGEAVALAPERFAALCRELDFGAGYQRLVAGLFAPAPHAGESQVAAADQRQAWFKLFEQSTLRLNLHLARLRGWLDADAYQDLLEVAKNGTAREGLERSLLTLWDVALNGIVLFRRAGSGGLVAYLPDEPHQPVQAFDSFQALHASLRQRLREPAWRAWFMRFVPARERDRLLQRIQRTLYPKVWNPGGWYEERYDEQASLYLDRQVVTAPLLDVLLQRKIAVLKDDGLFHAVPSAEQDHKSALAKVEYALGLAFDIANLAAFVVPGLGAVMLAVNGALLGYEVYEGFDSLARGEKEQAWGYFLDVGENLVMIAALGVAGVAAGRFEGNLPLAVRGMRPVTLADGSVRLWKPDMAPFAYDIRLPADLQPGANGLYDYQGRQWLELEGRYYSVRTLLGEEPGYRLEHPERPGAYEPWVRHNGNGGWLHEADTPQHWRGLELFHRQGPRAAGVSAELAGRALRISGVSEAQLRQALVDSRRPPALLSDTLRRLTLAEGSADASEFVRAYHDQQAPLSPAGRLLGRQFQLPAGLLEEIVGAATQDELDSMLRDARVPLRLAEEARAYLEQVRIARACEGLYLDLEANPDSACVLLHSLQGLADWPRDLHLALHRGSLDGPLLARIGAQQEPVLALTWRGQTPQAFCQTLFDALPQATRARLDLADAATLRGRLQAEPLPPRQRLRQWLGLAARKPAFRSPMRLADGRIGLPLSGRAVPFLTEDELLDKLRLLELEDAYAEDALQALYRSGLDRLAVNARLEALLGEMLTLRQCLDTWILESAGERLDAARQRSRERIGQALWEHWRRSILPELERPPARLILWQVQLIDLPPRLPAFFGERVRTLQLNDVIREEGEARQQVVEQAHVAALAGQFPNLDSLDIRGGQWPAGLPGMVARAWPRLAALGLHELGVLSEDDLRSLASLPRLRRLDLRGMRLGSLSDAALSGFTLDFLGLDWIGLQGWPQWLDNAALGRIGELSLVGNQLREIPPQILDDPRTVATPMRILLQGNHFSRAGLLDLRLAESFRRRFSFDLGLPAVLEQELRGRVNERRQIQATLREWLDPATSSTPLSPTQIAYRQRIGQAWLGFWRDSVEDSAAALLSLEDVALDDLPDSVPPFLVARVRRLELTRFRGRAGDLERFIEPFSQLAELWLHEGLPALGRVPSFLSRFSQLRQLALLDMGMTLDQAAMRAFARLPQLTSLDLGGNRLGRIDDLSMFQPRVLSYLGLSRMQIDTWPDWIDTLLPAGIERLGLDDNQLRELPALLLDNRRSNDGAVEISLRNNPLTRQTLLRAHVSQHINRPYSFVMDLPEDIAALPRQAHASDSESEPEDADSGASEDLPVADGDPASTWQTGNLEQDARNQHTWDILVESGDAEALLKLVRLLRHSADYRSPVIRGELVGRVWAVLAAAEEDRELRLMLNGMAEEPVQQMHSHETCPDGIRLEFNQIEFKVYTRQALRQITDADRGPALFRLMRGIFRTQTLDSIARTEARGRDEAEVRLAYRLNWSAELELPLPPRSMLYHASADIAQGELNEALRGVRRQEQGPGLLRFAAQCDFWVGYLRDAFAERFKALKDAYEAAVLEATEAYPDESAEQSSARIAVLEAKFRQDEQTLIELLTLQQSYGAS